MPKYRVGKDGSVTIQEAVSIAAVRAKLKDAGKADIQLYSDWLKSRNPQNITILEILEGFDLAPYNKWMKDYYPILVELYAKDGDQLETVEDLLKYSQEIVDITCGQSKAEMVCLWLNYIRRLYGQEGVKT